ncbi:MAG: YqeG family HAD IIIA-type phosphatase [Clostridia bacterium]|nr:YqeG family HAD IIIA-type phosphatase [Clostridia bacterium]
MKRFKPTYIIESVEKIPFVLLERDNIKGLIFDVDNTISTMGKGITEGCYKWIKEAKKLGYKVCILSNSVNLKKVRKIMQDLDVLGLCFAKKPSTKGFAMALDLLDLKKEEVIMIGDQVFTDVLGANRFGIKSILVNPINKKEGPFTLIKRPFEKIILKKLKEDEHD